MKRSPKIICSILLSLCCLLLGLNGATYQLPFIDHEVQLPYEWNDSGLKVDVLTRFSHVGVDQELSGEGRLRLGWTQEGVLLGVEVHDPDRIEGWSKRLYRGDSIEVFFASAVGANDLYQVIASPGVVGSQYEKLRHDTYLNGSELRLEEPIQVFAKTLPEGYIMQFLIPWSAVGLDEGSMESFAMQVMINDRDIPIPDIGNPYLRYMDIAHLGWYPDRMTYTDHTCMHQLILSDQPTAAGTLFDFKLAPTSDGSRLQVYTQEEYSGHSLQVLQDERVLGEMKLESVPSRLSLGEFILPSLNELGGGELDLVLDSTSIGRIRLYQSMQYEQSRLLDTLLSTENETERWLAILALRGDTEDPLLLEDISILEPLINLWANGRRLAMDGQLVDPTQYLMFFVNSMSPPMIRQDSPLYPIYCLYRARHIIWTEIQAGGKPIKLKTYAFNYARKLLSEAQELVPNNKLIGMYLGQSIPWEGPVPHSNAPDWANLQRESLEKIREITHFWVKERQLPNGSYGASWNDDVEMWRSWWPVMFAFEEPEVAAAQERLSEMIFSQPHMKHGFSSVMDDVEHSAEDSADTITPMLYLNFQNEVWKNRALQIAQMMRDIWTGLNEEGDLAFKSIVFNATGVSGGPHNAYDTTLDFRAVQPALVYWQKSHDASLSPLMMQWLETWVKATASDANGKPAGVLPSSIHWPTGRPGGPNHWWDTEGFSRLYNWPFYVDDALHGLLVAYEVTRDARYVEPLKSMAAIRRDFLNQYPEGIELADLKAGSVEWAAAQMGDLLPGALASYRMISGDTQFDDLLQIDGNGYVRFLIGGEVDSVVNALAQTQHALSMNKPMFTTEVRSTDRVYRYIAGYYSHFIDGLTTPDTRLIYATLTGDTTTWVGSRLPAVKWLTSANDFAALVQAFTTNHFKAQVFHFGFDPRQMAAEFPLLEPGKYRLILRLPEDARILSECSFEVDANNHVVSLEIPSGQLVEIEVIRQ